MVHYIHVLSCVIGLVNASRVCFSATASHSDDMQYAVVLTGSSSMQHTMYTSFHPAGQL